MMARIYWKLQVDGKSLTEISDEATLGQDVSASIAELKEDIKSVMEAVKEARAQVIDAVSMLRGASGEHRNLNPGEDTQDDEV